MFNPEKRKAVVSCMIGNALEWYDFVIYGYFASIISRLFFPSDNPFAGLLLTYGVFGAGFLARPIGAMVLGHIGDKFSRKKALVWSLYIMAFPTILIGCLPTYADVGIVAPILLTLCRLLQGFALGGEFTASMVFMVEIAPAGKTSWFGSWATFSSLIGVIMGSAIAMLISQLTDAAGLISWGWRVPFLISIFGSIAGAILRQTLADPSVYTAHREAHKSQQLPLQTLLKGHRTAMLSVVLIDAVTAIGFFLIVVFLPTFLQDPQFLGLPTALALQINTASMLIFALCILGGGWMGDTIPPVRLFAITAGVFFFFSYPAFAIMAHPGSHWIWIMGSQMLLSANMGIFYGVIPGALSALFPPMVRCSGLSISHNLSMMLFGGTAPWLATQLIATSGQLTAPAYLFMLAAVLCAIGLAGYRPIAPDNALHPHPVT